MSQLSAITNRDGDAKDVDSARTAVEVIALSHVVEPFVGQLRDNLAFCSVDFRKINELREKWSG